MYKISKNNKTQETLSPDLFYTLMCTHDAEKHSPVTDIK